MSSIPLAQVVYALDIGGSETLARRLALGLRCRRYVSSLYAVHGDGPLADILRADGIPCRAFSRKGKWDPGPLVRLVQQFRADGTKVVHTHHLGQLLYGGLAGRWAGCRVIHTEHEYFSLRRPRAQQLLRVLTHLADRVTAVAEPVKSFLEGTVGLPASKLITIQNGVEVHRYEAAIPHDREEWDLKSSDVIIGCVARLSPEKGHTVLLRAFRKVISRHPVARLVLIGDGEERERLQHLADDLRVGHFVRFLGLRADVPEVLAACDLFTLPSIQEGFPMVILEALAAGKAVIASEVGAIPDVIRHGATGMLVPPGDADALADALCVLIEDEGARQRLGQSGRELVREAYDFERTVGQYDELYQRVLGKAGMLGAGWAASPVSCRGGVGR
jgi:glycosyltransferase involved in cell wall biosynthesis